jgi:very-short-patch-repair endonuclease
MSNNGNTYYNKNLQQYSNALRKQMTKAEACLWKYVLRAGMMLGYQFRRQRPVLNYIADFMCKELMLIIEVDGITHHNEEQLEKDKIRQGILESNGFTVIRFQDETILSNLDGVRLEISKVIKNIEESTPLIPRQRGTRKN